MFVKHFFKQQTVFFEFSDNHRVGVFYENALEIVNFVGKSASVVHEFYERQIVSASDLRVVLAECGRNMHDARTVGKSNVIGVGNVPTFIALFYVIEKRHVSRIFVIFALFHAYDFVFVLFKKRGNKSMRHYEILVADFDFRIILFRVHAKRNVARERPGRCRPGKKTRVFLVFQFKTNVYGFFFYVLVSLRNLVTRQRRAASRAVRDNFIAFV